MASALVEIIKAAAKAHKAPSGDSYHGLALKDVERVARETGATRREVEIAALEAGIIPLRYQRNIGSIGIEGQLKLRRSRVAVIGAGGLGGTLVELLARLGIGSLLVMDGEAFTEDNLNRQILCVEDNVGMSKAEAARVRITRVNSAVDVEARHVVISRENVDSLIHGCDLVIDALDNIPVRMLLQEAARRSNIPFVHGAIAGFLGEVMTVMPGDKGLGSLFEGGKGIPEKGVEVEAGTPTMTPMVIAALQAMEAVKLIIGMKGVLRNKLLYLDLEADVLSMITLPGK